MGDRDLIGSIDHSDVTVLAECGETAIEVAKKLYSEEELKNLVVTGVKKLGTITPTL